MPVALRCNHYGSDGKIEAATGSIHFITEIEEQDGRMKVTLDGLQQVVEEEELNHWAVANGRSDVFECMLACCMYTYVCTHACRTSRLCSDPYSAPSGTSVCNDRSSNAGVIGI